MRLRSRNTAEPHRKISVAMRSRRRSNSLSSVVRCWPEAPTMTTGRTADGTPAAGRSMVMAEFGYTFGLLMTVPSCWPHGAGTAPNITAHHHHHNRRGNPFRTRRFGEGCYFAKSGRFAEGKSSKGGDGRR